MLEYPLGAYPLGPTLSNLSMQLSFTQFICLISYAAMMGASQILMANASHQLGKNYFSNGIFFTIMNSYWLYIALIFYIFATGIWLLLLYKIDIRIAYPIASTAIIFTSLIQCYLDRKPLEPAYWLGLLFIIIGIGLINLKRG
jgi:multidrug transporter EmrE-like cation transporter